MTKPSVFIGSATEGLPVAFAIRAHLNDAADIYIWKDVFELGSTSIETLMNLLPRFDIAIFVFTKDDWVKSQDTASKGPRDNVIFELGLFTGYLGRGRSVVVVRRE